MHRNRVVKLWSTIPCVIVLGVLAAAPGRAPAGAATEILRPAVDRVLHILADPALKGAEHTAERRQALQAVMAGVIDFPDAARRALGVHWQERTDAERDEFIALFKELVTYSYIVTMEGYASQSVAFVSEMESEGIATVLTKIQDRQGQPVPIEYRMHQRDTRWLVYDVLVEGVSLVGNYRTQFNSIIRTTSYPELIHRMRTRVGELKGGASPVALTRPLPATVFPGGLP
jgi:phospholipid transport system substrate-binding protein